jgi:aminocarboxymuconate-semialdehyde decarboxylase
LDSLVHDQDALLYLLKLVGANKVIMGSDYPFPLGEPEPGELIDSLNLTPQVKERLLCDNALEFLGLERAQFRAEGPPRPLDSQTG